MNRFVCLVAAGLLAACSKTPPTPPTALETGEPGIPAPFRDVAAATGLVFEHFIGASGEHYMSEIMGSGVALFDYDLDGDLDVYLLQGKMLGDREPGESLFPPPGTHWPGNRLYRNELEPGGSLRFTDVTNESGLRFPDYGMGAAVGDFDNDGDPDLYLTNLGPNRLLRNDGNGQFSDITPGSGTADVAWGTAAGFNDYDRDGDADLFLVNYVDFGVDRNIVCTSPGGRRDYCGPQEYPPLPDRLFRNDGNGRFTDVSGAAGLADSAGPGLGLVWADFNGDGISDAYVANDGAANFLWIGGSDGTFTERGMISGTAFNMMGSPEASMGVTAGDFDGDGDEDLFMTHLFLESNTLYLNDGKASFFDATDQFRLGHGSMAMTGFGSRWFDYDNDGFLDLFVANGNVKLEESRVGQSDYPFEQPNQLFHNDGGQRFTEIGADGDVLSLLGVSRGAAFGDIDNDGDLDIVVTNNNGPARLLLNESNAANNWLQITLNGSRSNRDGTGARIALLREDMPPLWRRSHTDGSYLSASDRRVHFGLGDWSSPVALEVHWPTGTREIFSGIAPNQFIVLQEGEGQASE